MDLLIAFTLLLQDRDAEDALRRIEEAIEKAGTIRVRFRGEREFKDGKSTVNTRFFGRLILREDNRVRLDMRIVTTDQEVDLVIVSDGTTTWARMGQANPLDTRKTPKSLRANMAGALSRGGINYGCLAALEDKDLWKSFRRSDLKTGPEEKGMKSVVFKSSHPDLFSGVESTLGYDPATFKPAMNVVSAHKGSTRISESYEEFILGGEIPDGEFKRPEGNVAAQDEDVADIPSQDLKAGGDADKRYFLIGPKRDAKEPEEGYGLVLVLPGGDGSADFHPFVKRIFRYALGDRTLAAEMVAIDWTGGEASRVVWPTRRGLPQPKMKFTTEEFVEAVVADVAGRHKIDRRKIYTLSWSSGGPAAYAVSLAPKSSITGSFIAMSVFRPDWLPALGAAKGHAYYLFQSPDDPICPLIHAERAAEALRKEGAKVELVTYPGGHGWRGPVFPNIRKGLDWLEKNAAGAAEK